MFNSFFGTALAGQRLDIRSIRKETIMTSRASSPSLGSRKGGTLGCSFGKSANATEASEIKKEDEAGSAFSWQSKVGNSLAEGSSGLTGHAKQAVILDMGEASREEGFRLNGCR
jgi:hypothetical protein